MGTENDIAQLQAEIDLKTSVLNTMKGLYVAQVSVLETPALAAKDSQISALQQQVDALTLQVTNSTVQTTPPTPAPQPSPAQDAQVTS